MGCHISKVVQPIDYIDLDVTPIEKNINDIQVLLIDESIIILKLMSKLLERKGLKNNIAINPSIALDYINKNWETNKRTFDIIILNVNILKKDKLFIEKVKQFEKNNNTKRHLICCLINKDTNITYNTENINYILFKPLLIDDFMEIVRKHYIIKNV